VNTVTSIWVLRKENNILIIWTTLPLLYAFYCVIYGYKYFKIWNPVYTTIALKTIIFVHGATDHIGLRPSNYRCFTITLKHTHTHTHTLGRAPLDEWWARNRELYLTTHNTHKRQTSMRSAGFEPAFPTSKRLQTHSLNRAATRIAWNLLYRVTQFTQVFLGFPVGKSKCWDGSEDTKLPLHASHAALPT